MVLQRILSVTRGTSQRTCRRARLSMLRLAPRSRSLKCASCSMWELALDPNRCITFGRRLTRTLKWEGLAVKSQSTRAAPGRVFLIRWVSPGVDCGRETELTWFDFVVACQNFEYKVGGRAVSRSVPTLNRPYGFKDLQRPGQDHRERLRVLRGVTGSVLRVQGMSGQLMMESPARD